MFNFLLLFLIFSWTLQAGSLPLQRLAWQMEGGDVRSIAGLCREGIPAARATKASSAPNVGAIPRRPAK